MGKALSSMGDTKRKQTLERWKEGKLSTWCITIDKREVHRQLLKRTRQVEMQLEQQVSKRQKLESEAKCLKHEVKSFKSIQVKQETTIIRLKAGRSENRGFSCKSWQSYSRQHQAAKKRCLASDIQSSFHFAKQGVLINELWTKTLDSKRFLISQQAAFQVHLMLKLWKVMTNSSLDYM